MSMPINWNPRLIVILQLILSCLFSGCDQASQFVQPLSPVGETATVPTSVIEISDLAAKTPSELFAQIEQSESDYAESMRLFESSGGRFRLANMQQQLSFQLAAFTQIETHELASDADRKKAIHGQLAVLSIGIEQGWDGYDQQLTQLRDRLASERSGSFEAAMADAVIIRQTLLDRLEDEPATRQALEAHANKYPTQITGPKLYARFAQLLIDQDRITEARAICEEVRRSYNDEQLTEPVDGVLRSIQHAEGELARRRTMLHARAAEFGGHVDGYFVLFLRPKKLKFMSRVDYVVACGLTDAVEVTDAADAWELKGWFPATPAGHSAALKLADSLREKNTIAMPTFESAE